MRLHPSRAFVAIGALSVILAAADAEGARIVKQPTRKAGSSLSERPAGAARLTGTRQVRPLRPRRATATKPAAKKPAARKPAAKKPAAKKPVRRVARKTASRRTVRVASVTAGASGGSVTTAAPAASASPLSSIVKGFYSSISSPAEVLLTNIVGSIVKYGLKTKEHNPFTNEVQTVALSREQEVLFGRQAVAELIPTMGISRSGSPMEAYLDGIVQRLVIASGIDQTTPYRFKVHLVHTDQVNAFALPGGSLVVTTGILRQMKSEAHIALILAHEIGHVVARHGSQNLAREELVGDLLTTLGTAAGHDPGAQFAVMRSAADLKSVMLSYTRHHENQSDRLGVRIMARAGYSGLGIEETAGHFIEHEIAHGPSDPATSDHPGAAERTHNMVAVAREVGLTRAGDHGADRFALNVTLPLNLGLF